MPKQTHNAPVYVVESIYGFVNINKQVVNENLWALSARQRLVLRMIFGINPKNRTHDPEELHKHFPVSQQRIVQITEKALQKIALVSAKTQQD